MSSAERLQLLRERVVAMYRRHPRPAGKVPVGRPREERRRSADALGITTMGLLYRERRAKGQCVGCGVPSATIRCAECRTKYNRRRVPSPTQIRFCRRCRGTGHNIQTCPEDSTRDQLRHRVRPAVRPVPLGPVGTPTKAQFETLLAVAELPGCSLKELRFHLGLKSMCAVQDRLRFLAGKGLVTWNIWRARSLRPTEAGWALVRPAASVTAA